MGNEKKQQKVDKKKYSKPRIIAERKLKTMIDLPPSVDASDSLSNSKKDSPSVQGKVYGSPSRLLIVTAVSIFSAEGLIMLFLYHHHLSSAFLEGIIDSLLLVAIVFPLLYFFSFRQINMHMKERVKAEEELRKANDELEMRVEERTIGLSRANENLKKQIAQCEKAEKEMTTAKEAAKVANQAKREFQSIMRHEIRPSTNAIIGTADLLRETPLNTEQKRYTEMLGRAGDSLLEIINNIPDE